jgi:hypothetical protein
MYDTFTGAADARNYDLTASSQSKLMKHTIPEATVGHEFVTKALLSDSDFNNSQQPTSAFSFARADSQIRNLPAFSSELVIILLVILSLLFLLDIGVLQKLMQKLLLDTISTLQHNFKYAIPQIIYF